MLTLIQPIARASGRLVLEFGSTYFEVDPSHGARVTSLRHAGQELLWLEGAPNYADAFGSTFWPSPQSWPWPPPAELDNGPYQVSIEAGGVVRAESAPNAHTSLRVSKTFAADLRREAVELTYTMTNVGETAVSWAPWEVTRLPADGLAFWPTGGEPFGAQPMPSEAALGHTWCEPRRTPGEGKLFADGAGGYLAYVLGDRLLIKRFTDVPASAAAPSEAEIELYVNPDHSYVEVENQGAYASLGPAESTSFRVVWYVRRLPADTAAAVGSADLVAFVAKTLE